MSDEDNEVWQSCEQKQLLNEISCKLFNGLRARLEIKSSPTLHSQSGFLLLLPRKCECHPNATNIFKVCFIYPQRIFTLSSSVVFTVINH